MKNHSKSITHSGCRFKFCYNTMKCFVFRRWSRFGRGGEEPFPHRVKTYASIDEMEADINKLEKHTGQKAA